MSTIPIEINVNTDISEVYDDIAVITLTGSSKQINLSVMGDRWTVTKCLSVLNALTKGKLKVKEQKVN